MFEKLRNLFRKDDVIKTPEDLQKVFDDCGMPSVKLYTIEKESEMRLFDPLDKIKIQMDCKRSAKK